MPPEEKQVYAALLDEHLREATRREPVWDFKISVENGVLTLGNIEMIKFSMLPEEASEEKAPAEFSPYPVIKWFQLYAGFDGPSILARPALLSHEVVALPQDELLFGFGNMRFSLGDR